MKRAVIIILLLGFGLTAWGSDTIVTKSNQKHRGTVVNKNDQGYVMRMKDGTLVVVPIQDISRIVRNNKVYDFEKRMGYYLETKRPFLPFIILGVAAGAYSVKRFQDYLKERDRVEAREGDDDVQDLTDKSGSHLAWSVASGLVGAGSFYIAFRPMQIMVPIGPINVGVGSGQISLAVNF